MSVTASNESTAGPAGLRAWLRSALEPVDSLCEATCGLVMTLTILLTAGFWVDGSDNPVRVLLLTAIGCNLAWGMIDGLLYVMSDLYQRSARKRFAMELRAADPATGRHLVRLRTEDALGTVLDGEELDAVTDRMYRILTSRPIERVRLRDTTWSSVGAAVICQMIALVPAIVPFVFMDDPRRALRVSNLLVVLTMAAVGWTWGRAAHLSPWRSSGALVAIGLTMVAVAVVFGG